MVAIDSFPGLRCSAAVVTGERGDVTFAGAVLVVAGLVAFDILLSTLAFSGLRSLLSFLGVTLDATFDFTDFFFGAPAALFLVVAVIINLIPVLNKKH
ncbi:MAG: hypothetical protein RQ982_02045 [Gammaproteobacteria bacterium]|nr:hypothetical protein [Gammaproteobacteria bacterium]